MDFRKWYPEIEEDLKARVHRNTHGDLCIHEDAIREVLVQRMGISCLRALKEKTKALEYAKKIRRNDSGSRSYFWCDGADFEEELKTPEAVEASLIKMKQAVKP